MYYSGWSVYKEVVTLERIYLAHLLFRIKLYVFVKDIQLKHRTFSYSFSFFMHSSNGYVSGLQVHRYVLYSHIVAKVQIITPLNSLSERFRV